jgi:predicted amidohydrolase
MADLAMVKSDSLQIAVLQLTSVDDVEANFRHIEALLELIQPGSCDLVLTPENALYMRVKELEPIAPMRLGDAVFQKLAVHAKRLGTTLHIGSVPLEKNGKLYNTSVLLHPSGEIQESYSKIHLFDVDVEGVKPVRESDVFAAGDKPVMFSIKGWKIASSICYDLRFADLYSRYASLEADLILIPSAFLVPTGRAHWDVLIRARAIESQAFVAAAAQGGTHHSTRGGGSRSTYGHSIVVDPWGEVLGQLPDAPGEMRMEQRILRAELKLDRLTRVRNQIPMRKHRKVIPAAKGDL